jgi:tetratricopeptide (TPR) repeat protein
LSEIESKKEVKRVNPSNENIIQFVPSAQLYYDRAMKAFEKRDFQKAIDYFSRGVSLAKHVQEETFGRVQMALMMQHSQDFDDSIALLNDLLEKSGNQIPELYYFQATNYVHIEEFKTALSLTETFLDMVKSGPYVSEAQSMKEMLQYRLSGI